MIVRHALRNSLIPVVTILGPLTAAVVTGSFVIEFVFGIPGMGKHFVTSIGNRDYSLITRRDAGLCPAVGDCQSRCGRDVRVARPAHYIRLGECR